LFQHLGISHDLQCLADGGDLSAKLEYSSLSDSLFRATQRSPISGHSLRRSLDYQ
jgi:hypothetical protein